MYEYGVGSLDWHTGSEAKLLDSDLIRCHGSCKRILAACHLAWVLRTVCGEHVMWKSRTPRRDQLRRGSTHIRHSLLCDIYIARSIALSVNCESRKTKLSVPGFGDYVLLGKDRELVSKL
jgi:hypothetical protein